MSIVKRLEKAHGGHWVLVQVFGVSKWISNNHLVACRDRFHNNVVVINDNEVIHNNEVIHSNCELHSSVNCTYWRTTNDQ